MTWRRAGADATTLIFNVLAIANLICEMGRLNDRFWLCSRRTADQHLTGQIGGATTIYREKISGVRADRPQLAKLMAALKSSDVVLVTKLDRLGRSTRELHLIDRIGKAGAVFRSLGDPLWDTSSPQGLYRAS
jgi:DNA invertase Pin-like site-specific DNA recombinase